MVAKKKNTFFFLNQNIQCDLSNERKLHQEFKYAIRKYFLPTWKFLYAKLDVELLFLVIFQKVPD